MRPLPSSVAIASRSRQPLRIGMAGAALASPWLVALAMALHAHARRADRARQETTIAVALSQLPSADLAISATSRWLRAPSLEEPGAAFADGPASRDSDPAGGAIAPPTEAWAHEASGLSVTIAITKAAFQP